MENHLGKFCANCYEMPEFHVGFLLPGLSLISMFLAKHYWLLVLAFSDYFLADLLHENALPVVCKTCCGLENTCHCSIRLMLLERGEEKYRACVTLGPS